MVFPDAFAYESLKATSYNNVKIFKLDLQENQFFIQKAMTVFYFLVQLAEK